MDPGEDTLWGKSREGRLVLEKEESRRKHRGSLGRRHSPRPTTGNRSLPPRGGWLCGGRCCSSVST